MKPLLPLLAFPCLCIALLVSPPPNSIASTNLSSTKTNTSSSSTSISNPILTVTFPHIVRVPNTRFWLWLKFRKPREPMSEYDIGGILALAADKMETCIEAIGADVEIPLGEGQIHAGDWEAISVAHDKSIIFAITALEGYNEIFTFGFVHNVIKGLQSFMMGGHRYDAVGFTVAKGRLPGNSMIAAGYVKLRSPPLIGVS